VINVDLLSVIRRWHGRDELPIREITRRTGLSRNTVKKYLATGDVSPQYPARKSVSKLAPYAETLASWLAREASRGRKRRRNLKQLHRDLVALGFDGSYGRIAAFARDWRQRERERANRASRGTFVPLIFAPGEAFQFDWSEDWIRIGGKSTKLQMAHFKLCHSRAFFLRAYPLQTHEMLFDAHNHAFRVLGGVSERGIYDNMKTAVDKVGRGKQRQVNARFRAMVSHFLYEAKFCNPGAGWEKGQVEKNVRDARHRLLQDAPAFVDLAALNDWLEQRCQALWAEIAHPELADRSIAEVLEDERRALMAMPPPFAELPNSFKRLRSVLMKRDGGDREMADILALVLHHDERLVEQAVREAIASGIVSKTHILNRLSRLLDTPPPAALEPPPALNLQDEPVANTERYEHLRENHYVG
jgi:transposase